eukprot:TRINITY_DN9195_c0_g1_i1.p1 TRINITY_DN9195_c0_g1~~TRINITY_DN9195_c0_g1_i1.p1  ORF type:complete len:681 (+),score=83.24 TRINITY_DN9195_c0_g1_i1:28-2043(+)
MNSDRQVAAEFLNLRDRANGMMNGLRSLPACYNQWEGYFSQTLNVFSKLWNYQQENRSSLCSEDVYGLQRWEIGELASSIGQLYFHYYLRTSDLSYLQESYVFYSAILSRQYFHGVTTSPAILCKKLRFLSRFLVVCALLNKRRELRNLATLFSQEVTEYMNLGPIPGDNRDWLTSVRELTVFLQADTPIYVKSSNLSKSMDRNLDHPTCRRENWETLQSLKSTFVSKNRSELKLKAAIIVDSHFSGNRIKFSELTVDMLRIILTLEPATINDGRIRSPSPIPKFLLYNPSIFEFFDILGTLQRYQSDTEILFVYLSGDSAEPAIPGNRAKKISSDINSSQALHSLGGIRLVSAAKSDPPPKFRTGPARAHSIKESSSVRNPKGNKTKPPNDKSDTEIPDPETAKKSEILETKHTNGEAPEKEDVKAAPLPKIHENSEGDGTKFSQNEKTESNGSQIPDPNFPNPNLPPVSTPPSQPSSSPSIWSKGDCLHPEDLIPFTRKPLFLVVDSQNSRAFLNLPNKFGVPLLVLCSPSAALSADISQSEDMLTFFLHSPLDAFFKLVSKTSVNRETYETCQTMTTNFFTEFSGILLNGDMPHVFLQFMVDPLLTVLIMRFCFFYATTCLFQDSTPKHLPASSPKIPAHLLLHPTLCNHILDLSRTLDIQRLFKESC